MLLFWVDPHPLRPFRAVAGVGGVIWTPPDPKLAGRTRAKRSQNRPKVSVWTEHTSIYVKCSGRVYLSSDPFFGFDRLFQ